MDHLKNIRAKVNDTFEFTSEQIDSIDQVSADGKHFHLLVDGKSYRAEVVATDFQAKSFVIKVNGSRYDIELADAYDQMVDRLGLKVMAAHAAGDVKAPMPGLVLDIVVEEGQTVVEGDALIVLEAMKMENVIRATGDGTVASIKVKKGAAVDKNQVMLEMA